ncbi:hypothetical protein [Frankia sp. R82]|uniref:hypothetical protein n=1 Tax=Frankia sp. R82 TaxID=2950553 RepID=UPI002043CD0C|nr:hypothetical protein [Frankia sp. R82]MCM3882640.1 hypothetical protein [Frankia sp. R82]
MDALKHGWIGLALFCAALVLMPALVFGYNKDVSRADEDRATVSPTTGVVDLPSTRAALAPSPGPTLAFVGIQPNEPISGFKRIEVESFTYSGPLTWVLNGPIEPYEINLGGPPYVFAPGSDQGWQTRGVANGQYTLAAVPVREPGMTISISFTVSNQTGVSG